MKALFTCSDKPSISRNRFHRQLLKKYFESEECISEASSYPRRIPSVLTCLPFKIPKSDFVYIGYMGHFLVLYVRFFTKKPIVFDFYLSIYDMLCNDRKIVPADSLPGKMIRYIEKRSLQLADFVIVDTDKLVETLSTQYGIEKNKFVRIPLTINEELVKPIETPRYKEPFCVLYVGSYIPLHGTPLIMEAARILQERGEDVHFLMIGEGPHRKICEELAEKYRLRNVEFKGFMPLEELNRYYNACDINLGLFNTGERANSVILNKTNDAFRVGKPHMTLRTDAMSEVFEDDETIFFVPENTPEALADRIVEVKNDPELRAKVSRNALKLYDEKLSNAYAEKIARTRIFEPLQRRIRG
jgi:glycosyltransferase involved in cell wall biosynthesis